jgi:hypothetical protein
MLLQRLCGGWANRADPQAPQRRDVASLLGHAPEEGTHAVGAGDDQPIVCVEAGDRRVKWGVVGGWDDRDRRAGDRLGT